MSLRLFLDNLFLLKKSLCSHECGILVMLFFQKSESKADYNRFGLVPLEEIGDLLGEGEEIYACFFQVIYGYLLTQLLSLPFSFAFRPGLLFKPTA